MRFGAISPQSTQEKSGQFRYDILKLTVLYYDVVFSLLSTNVWILLNQSTTRFAINIKSS